MFYAGTKRQLEGIVQWLDGKDQDEAQWNAQTDLTHACLAEMADLSEAMRDAAKRSSGRYGHNPFADKLNRAMPHIRAMLTAMRIRDRATALSHGETAMRQL
jgi:hypothetical protein